MCEEKCKQLPPKVIEIVRMDDDRCRKKNAMREIDEHVCVEGINNEKSAIENNTHISVKQTEKIKGSVVLVTKNKKGHFETDKNKRSTNKDAVYLSLELFSKHRESTSSRSNYLDSEKCDIKFNNETVIKGNSSPRSVDSDQQSFCCGSLNDSGIASAKFSMMISVVLLFISVQMFFKPSGEDETSTKMLVFCAGVYALCYLHCARKLIYGIEKEVREKFIAWIGFSVLSVFLLFSGGVYVLISSWDELKEIYKEPVAGGQTIALVVLMALTGCVLMYCTRIVLLLWNSLHVEESSLKGSCLHFMCHFCNSCALSFNSFSRSVSH